jgi:Transglycosylase SLT domain
MKKVQGLALTVLAGALAATALTAAPAAADPAYDAPSSACGSDPGSGTDVTRWNNVVGCVLGMLGLPASDELVNDVDIIIQNESNGNPNAINTWDGNAQAGNPSTGLVQVIQPTFDTYHSAGLSDNIWDPAANIFAGLNYGINYYGSIPQIPTVASVNSGGPYLGY